MWRRPTAVRTESGPTIGRSGDSPSFTIRAQGEGSAPSTVRSRQAIPITEAGGHIDRRTKIIATVGPASWDPGVLEQLIAAGADVFRLNFSHAGPERQAKTIEAVRGAAERVGREVAGLGDLPGPKLRIGGPRGDFAGLGTGG